MATPDAWIHSYHKITGGRRYSIADLAEPRVHPHPEEGYEYVDSYPLYGDDPSPLVEILLKIRNIASLSTALEQEIDTLLDKYPTT